MSRVVVALLRIAVAGAMVIGVYAAVVLVPTVAADEVTRFPPYAPLRVPYVLAAELAIVGILGALVAVWPLLSLFRREVIFTKRAFRWVDVVIGGVSFATLLALGVTVHLIVADIPTPADGMEIIGAILTTGGCAALGGTFVLFMIIMRQLLRRATDLRSEMAQVI